MVYLRRDWNVPHHLPPRDGAGRRGYGAEWGAVSPFTHALPLGSDWISSAKYPLAAASAIEEALPEITKVAGFDCGCKLSKTARRSDLKKALDEGKLRMVVGAFHGFAHNRLCQLRFLPRYIRGVGLTDFEVLERVFSKSNALAPVTRHSSAFHRRQLLAAYFTHIDRVETYQALSKSICIVLPQLAYLPRRLDCEPSPRCHGQSGDGCGPPGSHGGCWHQEQRRVPSSACRGSRLPLEFSERRPRRGKLEDGVRLHLEYSGDVGVSLRIPALILDSFLARAELSAAEERCKASGAVPDENLEIKRRAAQKRVDKFDARALHLEEKMGLKNRWRKEDRERKDANASVVTREYKLAVNHLEALVVSRIFELTKMNMSQTGESASLPLANSLNYVKGTRCVDKLRMHCRRVPKLFETP